MSAITDALDALLVAMQITGGGGQLVAGQPLTLGLAPALAPLSIVEIVPQPVALDFIGKNVDFANTNFSSPTWLDDKAIQRLPGQIDLTRVPPINDTGVVPGLIGKLTGMLPVAVPRIATPSLAVTWVVRDENGAVLTEGTGFSTANGTALPTLDIVFASALVEYDGGPAQLIKRTVEAQVVLTIGTENVSGTIGPIALQIPAIAVPRLIALTVDTNFLGAALIMVPGDSPVAGVSHLLTLLQPIRDAVQTLTTLAGVADFLLGIDTLTSIANNAHVEFRATNAIGNLNDITLIQRPWYSNDTEAEDELSSFVYLSPPPGPENRPGNAAVLFNDRHFDQDQGAMRVQTGATWLAMCASLDSDSPSATPSDAVVTILKKPSGWWVGNFNDEVSSISLNLLGDPTIG